MSIDMRKIIYADGDVVLDYEGEEMSVEAATELFLALAALLGYEVEE